MLSKKTNPEAQSNFHTIEDRSIKVLLQSTYRGGRKRRIQLPQVCWGLQVFVFSSCLDCITFVVLCP